MALYLEAADAMPPVNYSYEPLQHPRSIRLLELWPGQQEDSLDVKLSVAHIDDAPPFEAISYVWGQPDDQIDLKLGNAMIRIPNNLRIALQQCRYNEKPRILWADSVCIDQTSKEEQSQQVALMGLIYQTASQVLVSLGEEDDTGTCQTTFKIIKGINQEILAAGGLASMARLTKDQVSHYVETYQWDSWHSFFKTQPWFNRVWTVQEIGLAGRAIVMCGSLRAEWLDIMRVSVWLLKPAEPLRKRLDFSTNRYFWSWFNYNVHERIRRGQTSMSDIFGYYHAFEAQTTDFLEVLKCASHRKGSDQLDYVYASLGHPNATFEGELLVQPAYEHTTVFEVYTGVTKRLIETTGSLRILSCVSRSSADFQFLPSWVPHWNKHRRAACLGSSTIPTYHASRGKSAQAKFSPSGNCLQCMGFVFDAVCWSSNYMNHLHLVDELNGRTRFTQSQIASNLTLVSRQAGLFYGPGDLVSTFALTLVAGNKHKSVHLERDSAMLASFSAYRYQAFIAAKAKSADNPEDWRKRLLSMSNERRGRESLEDISFDIEKKLKTSAAGETDPLVFLSQAKSVATGRRFFVTKGGHFGLGPRAQRKDDVVCILYGGQTPYVLRKLANGQYIFIGECYVHGMMQGEAFSLLGAGETQEQWFELV